jgi:hypothetical protein
MSEELIGEQDQHAARDWLCQCLSPYCALPEPPREDLWAEIITAADAAKVLARLAQDVQPLKAHVPVPFMELLDAVADYNEARNQQIVAQTRSVISLLNGIGIEPVLLKGNALFFQDPQSIRTRVVGDLDIWVTQDAQVQAAIELFLQQGYYPLTPLKEFEKDSLHHYPPFIRDDQPVRIELHHRLSRKDPDLLMDEARMLTRFRRVEEVESGLVYQLLDPRDGLTHSYIQCTHMAAPHFHTGRVPFMKWVDFLDRCQTLGISTLTGRADCGVLGQDDDIDRQFFTAISDFFSIPYQGKRDETYLVVRAETLRRKSQRYWARDTVPEVLSGVLSAKALRNIFNPWRWKRSVLWLIAVINNHRSRDGL